MRSFDEFLDLANLGEEINTKSIRNRMSGYEMVAVSFEANFNWDTLYIFTGSSFKKDLSSYCNEQRAVRWGRLKIRGSPGFGRCWTVGWGKVLYFGQGSGWERILILYDFRREGNGEWFQKSRKYRTNSPKVFSW